MGTHFVASPPSIPVIIPAPRPQHNGFPARVVAEPSADQAKIRRTPDTQSSINSLGFVARGHLATGREPRRVRDRAQCVASWGYLMVLAIDISNYTDQLSPGAFDGLHTA